MTERLVLSFGTGAVILSVLVFGLCAAGLARTPWLVCAALATTGVMIRFPIGGPRLESPRLGGRQRFLLWAFIAPFAVLYRVNAAAPEISPDGSYYHLGLVRRYLNHGGFYAITTDLFASFPQGAEMLFLVAYSMGKHSAAALSHLAFLFALPAAMIAYSRRFGFGVAGIVAALLVFVAPVVGIDGSSAYVDVALAFSGFACFYLVELWDGGPTSWRVLPWAGLMAGFCFAIKYTGAAALCFAVIYVAWRGRSLRFGLAKPLAALAAPALFVMIPWLVKNWVTVANPVSPFFNRWFPNPYVHVSFENELRDAMRHLNGASIGWRTPAELTIGGGLLQGTLGPAFLLAPIALGAARTPNGRRILAAAALFALPWFTNIGTRFLIPALPFVALAMGIAIARYPRMAAALALANAVACWPWVLDRYCSPANWRLTRFPVAAALRITPEEAFLETYAPEIRYARLLQSATPPGSVIYTAQPVMTSYTDRTVLLNYTSALNSRLEDTLAAAVKPDRLAARRVVFRYPARSLARVRIVASGEAADWAIHEIEGETIRLFAQPNSWDARLAGDGLLATSWRAWEPVRPGMYFEIALPPSRETGVIAFRTRSGGPLPPLRLDGESASGEWSTLSSTPVIETGLSVPDPRPEAIAELRRNGVTHVLIHDQEPLGPDFRTHTTEWRVRLTGESPPLRLYSLDRAESIDRTKEVRNNTR